MFFVGKEKSSSLLQLGGAEEIDLRTQPYSISTGEGEGEGEGGGGGVGDLGIGFCLIPEEVAEESGIKLGVL